MKIKDKHSKRTSDGNGPLDFQQKLTTVYYFQD